MNEQNPSPAPEGGAPERVWHVYDGIGQRGPFTTDEVRDEILSGVIRKEDMVWRAGFVEWREVERVAEFENFLQSQSFAPTGPTPERGNWPTLPPPEDQSEVPYRPEPNADNNIKTKRIVAFVIDYALIHILWIPLLLIVIFMIPPEIRERMESISNEAIQTQNFEKYMRDHEALLVEYVNGLSGLEKMMLFLIGVFPFLVFGVRDSFFGKSPGKALMRLRVINMNTGQPGGVSISLRRNLLFMLFGVIPIQCLQCLCLPGMIELLPFAADPQGRRLGDRMAGSVVVED